MKTGNASLAQIGEERMEFPQINREKWGRKYQFGYALQSGTPVIGLGTWSLARGGVTESSIIVALNPADAVD